MADTSPSIATMNAHLHMELFRPPLHYPSYPYAAMLAHTTDRYPEHVALLFKDVNLTYRELDALVNSMRRQSLPGNAFVFPVSEGQKYGRHGHAKASRLMPQRVQN